MRSVGRSENGGAATESGGIGRERRTRTTVLLLVRLALAVLVILMCSWAMAIAWAGGARGDADSPRYSLEAPVQRVPEFNLETGEAGSAHYLQECTMAPWLKT